MCVHAMWFIFADSATLHRKRSESLKPVIVRRVGCENSQEFLILKPRAEVSLFINQLFSQRIRGSANFQNGQH